jgi:hypothetical protein
VTLQPDSEIGTTSMPGPLDFSLVLGGPLFQLLRRAHLSGDALELLRRRTLAITIFTWLPLVLTQFSPEEVLTSLIKILFR